tara:strand:+ start:1289 stop:1930 length:642 start_codon:yes stop_codon:yes gene_type:complete
MNNFLLFYGGDTCLEIISYLEDIEVINNNDAFHIIDIKPNKKRFSKITQQVIFYKKIEDLKIGFFKGIYITSGFPNLREHAYQKLKKKKLIPNILIHPKSYIAKHSTIGQGSIMAPFSLISPHSKIGKNCFINSFSSIGHHSQIGDSNVFCPYSVANGNCKIGNNNFFGSGSVINPTISIGNYNKVSSNSVLQKKMSHKSLAHGNPAKIIKIF